MVANKTVHVALRTTAGRRLDYRRAAAREGLRLSEWLRRVADRAIAERAQTPEAVPEPAGT